MSSEAPPSALAAAPPPVLELNVECFDCTPEYQPLRDAIAADDWATFSRVLSSWPPEDMTRALFHLGEHDDEAYVAFPLRHADEPLAMVACAYHQITEGWRARGTWDLPASDDQLERFRRHLARAEQHLVQACAIDPFIASAWTARVLTARALNLSTAEARRRFTRSTAVGDDVWAHMHLHQFLEPYWFGSVEAARQFVDESIAESVDGSLIAILAPLFHIERWREHRGAPTGRAYLASDEVQRELDSAAARSVLHASRSGLSPTLVYGHQVFLAAYWLAGEKRKAARHRDALGARSASEYWDVLATGTVAHVALWRELTQLGGGAA